MNIDLSYALTPFLAWLVTGVIKFILNCIREHRLAFDRIGYGGMPSNHTAIAFGVTALIAFREGISNPAFGIALAFTFIVILDATSLRRQVGRHAAALNRLLQERNTDAIPLRERMGHSKSEIIAGLLVGILVALAVNGIC